MKAESRKQKAEMGEGAFQWERESAGKPDALQTLARIRLGNSRSALFLLSAFCFLLSPTPCPAAEEVRHETQPGKMVVKEGDVNFRSSEKTEVPAAQPQPVGFGDALHTLQLSRATVRFIDWSELRMKELTRLEVQHPSQDRSTPGLMLHEGQIYVSERSRLGQAIVLKTPHVEGLPKGTEFLVSVDLQKGQTEVTMLDGEAQLRGPVDPQPVRVRSGEQGITVAGQPTQVRPILQAQNIVQWWIYYPGLLAPDEIGLSAAEQTQLAASLAAYRQGDLQEALKKYPNYPAPADPPTDARRCYLAGLFLAIGAVDRANALLGKADSNAPPALALHTMIRAVTIDFRKLTSTESGKQKAESGNVEWSPTTASEWLAVSYAHQATNNLRSALQAARKAVERAPTFGFAWARVGELEFSFGHTHSAREAAENAIHFSPRNAQAHALNGFLLAADNRIRDALVAFDQAIAIDPGLGNAWLGRGLCKRRITWSGTAFSLATNGGEGRGEGAGFTNSQIRNQKSEIRNSHDWLDDLQTAAILEPTRSLVRSYAGKAIGVAGDERLARQELAYAAKLDPNDPTPWLYSALENWQENRFNEGVGDLEHSIELNDNRALFRSRLLLDEDLAVRSSSLARIYQKASMPEVSLREAARAVSYDYANYSAHQFISDSFDALRDPTRFNLRYETVWFNELLLADLLSPVGGTPLSQHISQQEYSRLLEGNRIGLLSSFEYRSDGQFRELASQYGTIGNSGWSLDLDYQHNDGVRPNNGLDRIEWYSTLKQQLTAQDSVLLLTKYQDYHSGDNFQYFDPKAVTVTTNAVTGVRANTAYRPNFKFDEYQSPILLGGYHHEWQPGVHTLFLGGRLENDQRFSDTEVNEAVVVTNNQGRISSAYSIPFDANYRSQFEIYTAELTQIFQRHRQSLVFGARVQTGEFETTDRLNVSAIVNPGDAAFYPPAAAGVREPFRRLTGYGYYSVELVDNLLLTGGLAYDHLKLPENFRQPPIAPGTSEHDRVGPKAALVWNPIPEITLRGIFSRGLGGASFDESFRLEPTQLAGFNQSFRTIISESVAGSVAAPKYQVGAGALDVKLKTNTYLGLEAQLLDSDVAQQVGVFALSGDIPPAPAGVFSTPERLAYEERSIAATINQLISDEWSLGAQYRFSRSELRTSFPNIPAAVPSARQDVRAEMQRATLFALFNHPSGFFARAEAQWYHQNNWGYSPSLGSSDFYQCNALVGWHFHRNRGEISLGVLNLNDTDYRLNPLNLYAELPRERTFVTQLRFSF